MRCMGRGVEKQFMSLFSDIDVSFLSLHPFFRFSCLISSSSSWVYSVFVSLLVANLSFHETVLGLFFRALVVPLFLIFAFLLRLCSVCLTFSPQKTKKSRSFNIFNSSSSYPLHTLHSHKDTLSQGLLSSLFFSSSLFNYFSLSLLLARFVFFRLNKATSL